MNSQITIQENKERSTEASKQMVYNVFGFVLALFEELQEREIKEKNQQPIPRSDIKIPDQTKKDTDDIMYILEVEINALQKLIYCCGEERASVRKQLREITEKWRSKTHGYTFTKDLTLSVECLYDVLYNRKITSFPTATRRSNSMHELSHADQQTFLNSVEESQTLDAMFKNNPNRMATLPRVCFDSSTDVRNESDTCSSEYEDRKQCCSLM